MTHDTDRKDEGLREALHKAKRMLHQQPGYTGTHKAVLAAFDAYEKALRRVSSVGGDGKCFECGHDLQAPICPKCNPHLDARPSPPSSGEGELREVELGHWETLEGLTMAKEYLHPNRAHLCGAQFTDMEVAHRIAMLSRNDPEFEPALAMAKDRIRWLSVQLALRSRPTQPQANAGLVEAARSVADYWRPSASDDTFPTVKNGDLHKLWDALSTPSLQEADTTSSIWNSSPLTLTDRGRE